MSYCKAIEEMPADSPHRHYHDKLYGFPLADDNALFGRLVLEINQAGLSWTTILNKWDAFFDAYDNFDIAKVADYGVFDTTRLLSDPGIIRNRLKVNAAIHNAQVIQGIQQKFGGFSFWIDSCHPMDKKAWVKHFKTAGFKFVGGEIMNEFLMSTGYLPGAHDEDCTVYQEILKLKPKWLQAPSK